MDLALSRLSTGDCARTLEGADDFALGGADGPQLAPDNRAYSRLVSQLSAVVAPGLLSPVTTRGPAGFDVAFDTNVTSLDNHAGYWSRGTRGNAVSTCDGRNDDVRSALSVSRLRFTKGLPLGLSVGANIGKLQRTSLWMVGAELKLALIEGLTQAWAPALGLRLATSRLVGDGTLGLTTVSADVVVSKEWVALRALKVVPYLAVGSLWTRSRTGLVDLTPNVDSLACADGSDPLCNASDIGTSRSDLGNDRRFAKLGLTRYRAFVGVWLRYGVFALAVESVFDLVSPQLADSDLHGAGKRQWGINLAPSLSF